MLFNSLEFAVFFFIVYSLYLVLGFRWQNRMLLAASYVFYGAWDWRFLFLILFSTTIDYFLGQKIYRETNIDRKKWLIAFSVIVNLSFLGFFKYFNFFTGSLGSLLQTFGFSPNFRLLHIVLPVGISFYTFQSMSYTIDIYRGHVKPASHFADFALFVSFFPQLVAGPIQRASHLLPQVTSPRTIRVEEVYEGGYLMLWGLFQKMFVADHLAQVVDLVFNQPAPYHGAQVLLAVYAFAFQIYCDFAGYSNIARGIGKCMGFDLIANFNLPYFAENPSDFWKRWHISLSSWLRDYLYIPLGGNRKGKLKAYRNLFLTMLLGGLWHGASWTFVIWGAYHGTLLSVHKFFNRFTKKSGQIQKTSLGFIKALKIIFFFHCVCLGWLFFRAQSMTQVFQMLHALLFDFHLSQPGLSEMARQVIFFSGFLILIECFQYWKKDLLVVWRWPVIVRWTFYVAVFHLTFIFLLEGSKQFIYFQF